jgi:hypothetical protein
VKVNGRCHCGQITYEAIVDPDKVTVCRCTDCQMLSGSAFRTSVPAAAEAFSLRTGSVKTFVKAADSGTGRTHAFCPDCGTPVYSCAIEKPSTYTLRIGCLQQRADLAPRRQIWRGSALKWSNSLLDLPSLDRQ